MGYSPPFLSGCPSLKGLGTHLYKIVPMDNSSAAVYAGEPFHLRVDETIEAQYHHLAVLFHDSEVWLVTLPTDDPPIALAQEIAKYEDLAEVRLAHTGSVHTTPYTTTFYVGKAGTDAVRNKLLDEGINDILADTMIAPRRTPGGKNGPLLYWRLYP